MEQPYFRNHQLRILLSLTLSFIFHGVLIAILLILQVRTFIKEKDRFIRVSIYVNKETPLAISGDLKKTSLEEMAEPPKTTRLIPKEISRDHLIEERLHAIKAKKRVERIARLRADLREINPAKSESGLEQPLTKGPTKGHVDTGAITEEKGLSEYVEILKATIQKNWHYPELLSKGLSAMMIIYIRKDGTVEIIDFKTSGDRLFDYSVKNALIKSSPLPPPPEECEIEVRFSR